MLDDLLVCSVCGEPMLGRGDYYVCSADLRTARGGDLSAKTVNAREQIAKLCPPLPCLPQDAVDDLHELQLGFWQPDSDGNGWASVRETADSYADLQEFVSFALASGNRRLLPAFAIDLRPDEPLLVPLRYFSDGELEAQPPLILAQVETALLPDLLGAQVAWASMHEVFWEPLGVDAASESDCAECGQPIDYFADDCYWAHDGTWIGMVYASALENDHTARPGHALLLAQAQAQAQALADAGR
jgi:hypothetical protein